MNQFTRIGLLTGAFALSSFAGCSKEDKAADSKGEEEVVKSAETAPAETAPAETAPAEAAPAETATTDVAGLSKETLLVLKFHHDS